MIAAETVPALSSSLISPALEQLRDLPAGDRALLAGECPSLAECLERVPDPRDPRGVRHTLTSLLLAAIAAVLAGAKSFTAIGEWAADAPPQVLGPLGVRRDPLTGRFAPPDEATIRRVLESVDAGALAAAVGSWAAGRLRAAGPGLRQGRRVRRALAVDGKTVRGTRHARGGGQAVHLLAIADQQASAVLAQASVDGKTNEITAFAPLLEPLNLAGCVITADALHTQREHAQFLVTGKQAHYILVVKKNQPSLYAQLKNLPWRKISVSDRQHDRGHGRDEHRTLQAATVAAGLAFPHAAQAIRVTRRIRPLSGQEKWRTVTVYAITSLTASQASPAQLPDGYAGTGTSKCCTTSATPPTVRTPPRSAPATAPKSWHRCGTWPSQSSNSPAAQHRGRLPPPCPGRHQGPGHTRTCPVMPKMDMTPLC